MAQFDNNLRPIIVDGKARLSTRDRYVPAYQIRIWSRCRAGDRLYHVVGDKMVLLNVLDEADVELSNKFHVERERERWKN